MIATRNGLSRSLHVGIYAIFLFFIFLYTLLFLYVVCCQNKIILILILILRGSDDDCYPVRLCTSILGSDV